MAAPAALPRIEFVVQHSRGPAVRAGPPLPDSVEILAGYLDTPRFSELLHSVDLAALPYDPLRYRLRGSAVAQDCASHGVPVVVPAGCALEEYVAGGNGLTAWSDRDFAAAIARIARDYDAFAAASARVAATTGRWFAESGLPQRVAASAG